MNAVDRFHWVLVYGFHCTNCESLIEAVTVPNFHSNFISFSSYFKLCQTVISSDNFVYIEHHDLSMFTMKYKVKRRSETMMNVISLIACISVYFNRHRIFNSNFHFVYR